jgi:hypothetical protein
MSAVITLAFGRFLEDKNVFLSFSLVTKSDLALSTFKFFSTVANSLVLGDLKERSSKIKILSSLAL